MFLADTISSLYAFGSPARGQSVTRCPSTHSALTAIGPCALKEYEDNNEALAPGFGVTILPDRSSKRLAQYCLLH
jgi:hypothetical protein